MFLFRIRFFLLYSFFFSACVFLATSAYSTGSMTSVSMVEVKRPPMTTVANGRCTSAPAEPLTAIGKKPSIAAAAVSMIGRRRS